MQVVGDIGIEADDLGEHGGWGRAVADALDGFHRSMGDHIVVEGAGRRLSGAQEK
jgi:hypothetical protein